MTFSEAVEAMRQGKRVRRDRWRTGLWLILVPGSTITVTADRPLGIAAPELVGEQVSYGEHIDKMNGGTLSPWAPTNEALLATDWAVVVPSS